jgi:apolipoprotein N-acyltransferase
MPIPSLYISRDGAQTWSVSRAAAYGAGIGALAALFKTMGPFHHVGSAAANFLQIVGAALAFAILCAGAAVLRNFVARRLVWPGIR